MLFDYLDKFASGKGIDENKCKKIIKTFIKASPLKKSIVFQLNCHTHRIAGLTIENLCFDKILKLPIQQSTL